MKTARPRRTAPTRRKCGPQTKSTFPAVAVVGEHAGGRIVHVAPFPRLVGHPEIRDHLRLPGVVLFKDLPIQQRFLCERLGVIGILFRPFPPVVAVTFFGVRFQIVHHRMPHRVGKRRLFPIQKIVREIVPLLEGAAQEILALPVDVDLLGRIDRHHIAHEIEIAEGHARLHGVDGNTPVRAQNVVHMQFAYALLRLLLKRRGRRREIGVFVAEQLVRDLPREQHADIRHRMDLLADEIHSHARADGRDIERGERTDDKIEIAKHFVARHIYFRMLAADVVGDLLCVFQVDRVLLHADGKRADGFFGKFLRDGADERGIQPAREQKSDGRVRVEPLFHARNEFFADIRAHGIEVVRNRLFHARNVLVAVKLPAAVVMPGRKGRHLPFHDGDEVFRLARKHDLPVGQIAVVERADPDGIARGNILPAVAVIDHAGELRVEAAEHFNAVQLVEREQDLAVGIGGEREPHFFQTGALFAESVQLPVAHGKTFAAAEGLHPLGVQPHNGETVKPDVPLSHLAKTAHIRSARDRRIERGFRVGKAHAPARGNKDRTHRYTSADE